MKSYSLISINTIGLLLLLTLPLFGQWTDADQWQYYISSGQVNDAIEEEDALWLATDYGLTIWNKTEETATYYYPHNSNLPGKHISAISRATDGTIWIGTYDNMLAFFQDDDWVPADVPVPDDFTSDPLLHDLEFGPDGTKYIGTNYGLVTEKDGNWTIYPLGDINSGLLGDIWEIELDPVSGDIFLNGFEWHRFDGTDWYNLSDGTDMFFYGGGDICADPTGTIWATNLFSGIARYQNGEVTFYDNFNEDHWVPSAPNSSLLQLEYFEGAVHLITQNGQLYRFENEQWVLQVSPFFDGLTSLIEFFFIDDSGEFWATESSDIFRLSNGEVQVNDLSEYGFSSYYARHFLQGPEPDAPFMVIDGYSDIFTYQEDGSMAPFSTPLDTFMFSPYVLDAKWNSNNELWMATGVGILRLKDGEWTQFHNDLGNFPTHTAVSIDFDAYQRPYLATDVGVYYYHNEDWVSLNLEAGLPIYDFDHIRIDNSGTIWLLRNYENLLIRVEGDEWSGFDHTNSPWDEDGYIHSLIETENNGLIVIGNYQSLYSFQDEQWSTIDIDTDEPFGTYIYEGFEGPEEQLILSTNTGMYFYKDGVTEHYDTDNSLMLNSSVFRSALATDGALWMSTNGDGVHRMANFSEPITTSTSEPAEKVSLLSVYPNPITAEVITIRVPDAFTTGKTTWSMTNQIGQVIQTGLWEQVPGITNHDIHLGDLTHGWYILQIKQGERVWISKVIVQ